MSKLSVRLQCPLPKLDFEFITLGHGGGGLLTHQLLEKGVFDLLRNDLLDQQHDGAVFALDGPLAFSTDSFVISPLFFPGGDIGSLAVHGTVNDLAMCGATPRYLSLAFILEEGLPMTDFWEILLSIKQAAEATGVQIVTGDTKVVEKGKGDRMFINTTGIGTVHPRAQLSPVRLRPGQRILVSHYVATHGVTIMSEREGLRFEADLQSDSRPLHAHVAALLDAFGAGICLLRDATRGGVASVLNEIADRTDLGFALRSAAVPVREAVASACEMLGLDPLYVANEGVFVAFVEADIAEACVAMLRQMPGSEAAALIGEVVADHPRKVVATSGIGGRRVVNLLPGEQLPRIC